MSVEETFYTMSPAAAQRALGLSASGLRRVVQPYEEVFDRLEVDASGARVWTSTAVERLRAARALVADGRARSVKLGLEMVRGGAQMPEELPPALSRDSGIPDALIEELRALRREVEGMRGELAEMRALPSAEGVTPPVTGSEGGVFVRLAHRLERLLGRRST